MIIIGTKAMRSIGSVNVKHMEIAISKDFITNIIPVISNHSRAKTRLSEIA